MRRAADGEAVPRAGAVGGGGRFFLYQIFFTDQIFYPNFFSFDFDAIFFILSIFLFSDANFFYQFFSILKSKKISQNFSIFCLSNFFFLFVLFIICVLEPVYLEDGNY